MSKIIVRSYKKSDAPILAKIYCDTIHNVNIYDYTTEQLNAWAPYNLLEDQSTWQKKLDKTKPFVAEINNVVVGFAEYSSSSNGYIDCFYVHHEYQRRGIGSALMRAILSVQNSNNRIFAEVSITAKKFFMSQGFKVVKKQKVTVRGVKLANFIMERFL